MHTNWITDRVPITEENQILSKGLVWTTNEYGDIFLAQAGSIKLGQPWHDITKPEPYVKPAWVPKWSEFECCWILFQRPGHSTVRLRNLPEENAEEAQQIANIYNKVYYYE